MLEFIFLEAGARVTVQCASVGIRNHCITRLRQSGQHVIGGFVAYRKNFEIKIDVDEFFAVVLIKL